MVHIDDGYGLYALLGELDARCLARGAGLPSDPTPTDSWTAVLFRVRARRLLAPLEQIAEVIELPGDLTRIPGTKTWLLGVANHRGTLLPVYDLGSLLEGGAPQPVASDRVLVVRQPDVPCGLLVNETVGIRRLRRDDAAGTVATDPTETFLDARYRLDDEDVPVLRLDRLMADPMFNAALGA